MIHFRPTLGLAEGDAVVVDGEEGLLGCHFVHLEFDGFAL